MNKRILLLSLLSLASLKSQAQAVTDSSKVELGQWQVGLFGGISNPLGTYKSGLLKPKIGPLLNLQVDKFFGNNHFGIGVDFRYLQHKKTAFDAATYNSTFANGYIRMDETANPNFKYTGIAIGPSFRTTFNKFEIGAYIRGGLLFQSYPSFQQQLFATDPVGVESVLKIPLASNNEEDKPMAPMAILGGYFGYNISKNISLALQVDYLSAFGEKGKYHVKYYDKLKEIDPKVGITFTDEKEGAGVFTNNIEEFYSKDIKNEAFTIQNLNVSLGVKFRFGGNTGGKKSRGGSGGGSGSSKGQNENIIVVKDKLTGFNLSGVKVEIKDKGQVVFTGMTNANGEVRFNLNPNDYQVVGTKNNIATRVENINKNEFSKGNVYKEILLNDERFTLIGQTIDCKNNKNLGGISTSLSKENGTEILSQTSDEDGKFVYQLNPNSQYYIVANESGKYSQTEFVTTKGLNRSQTLYVNLKLGVCDLKEGDNIVLKNIYYDFDAANINRDAAKVLDNVVSIMKANPLMHIELTSHTDSRGEKNYNQTLSQKRADAAISYIISKGISKNRLKAKGYGESRLTNDCKDGVNCNDEEHAQNRRTEIQILKYK